MIVIKKKCVNPCMHVHVCPLSMCQNTDKCRLCDVFGR